MITFKQLMEDVSKHKAMDLTSHIKDMSKYSHGPSHVGYLDKGLNSGTSHKKLHAVAKAAGYNYYRKDDTKIGDKDMTYHLYTKSGGPFTDHHMTITTPKGSDKVWSVEHKTVKDNS
jgi:hypothetical protein